MCSKLAICCDWVKQTLMEVSLAGKTHIIQCFQGGLNTREGGKCIMYYEVYCNRVKHQCLNHNSHSRGIYKLVSKIRRRFQNGV